MTRHSAATNLGGAIGAVLGTLVGTFLRSALRVLGQLSTPEKRP